MRCIAQLTRPHRTRDSRRKRAAAGNGSVSMLGVHRLMSDALTRRRDYQGLLGCPAKQEAFASSAVPIGEEDRLGKARSV